MPGMSRPKAAVAAEMAVLIQACHERFGLAGELPDGDALKTAYQGWRAVLWAERYGRVLDAASLDEHLGTSRTLAGNSVAKRLWRERILYVQPLKCHVRLPPRLPGWVLRAGVQAGHFPPAVALDAQLALPAVPQPYLLALSNKPGVLIDRATRGPGGWNDVTLQYREVFEDGLLLNYFEENAGQGELRAQLMTLDPRTSDVWRLLTARALENEGGDLFTPITIKPGELARALGLKLHPNGSVRPKDLVRCTQSLFHLERLWLTMPDGEGAQGAPKKRVLAVMERGRTRRIDGQDVPSSWTLVLGDWARYFPRSFAPIFRNLVELPANSATNLWAKQMGTELSYWLRETAGETAATRFINVRTLLTRASVMQEVLELRQHKNQNRAVERFEATLELLGTLGLHQSWCYEARSAAAMDQVQGRPEFFETWLSSLVQLSVPAPFLQSIAELSRGQAAERHLSAEAPMSRGRPRRAK